MRELKFRAWDKETSRMMRVTQMDWLEWNVCVGEDNPKNMKEYYIPERNSFKNEETDRFILMQYTGLKDKEKTDAYQGDKLYFKGELWGLIEYHEESGGWMATSLWEGSIGNYLAVLSQRLMDEMEIIGNIHEKQEA